MTRNHSWPFDRVVVSVNEHWLYFDFWPLVAYAYRTMFPGVEVTLAFLTERLEDDPVVTQMRRHSDVRLVRPDPNIPQSAQAKLARFYIAAQCGNEVVYIDDIDVLPIDRDWHLKKVSQRRPGTMLLVGAEVYGGDPGGQVPASMMTGEGYLFKALFNPSNDPFGIMCWKSRRTSRHHADLMSRSHHEGMNCTTSQERLGEPLFSDEVLIVELRKERAIPVTHVRRDYEVGVDTIDRSWWAQLDFARLEAGKYLTAHTGRPYVTCRAGNDAIVDYLRRRYGGGPLPELVVKRPQVDPDMSFGGSGMTREAFQWVCEHVPAGALILEFGSGHVSTNYLSRYYFVVAVENSRQFLNLYPAHYIYAPIVDGWYDVAALREGLVHRRFEGRDTGLVIVDGPAGDRSGILKHPDVVGFRRPTLVDDVERESERRIAVEVGERRGKSIEWYGQFAVIC